MITISTSGSAVVFEFDDNQHYLQSGTIEVPINSLTLVTDDSEMFTFRKAATNDIFVSGLYSEIGMTKDELIAYYKANMVGSTGGGMDSGAVQTMIDESISGKQDTLSAGTNITISGNVISAEGKAIEAGTNISVTTGETADTINCILPISGGTGEGSIIGGYSGNTASGKYSIALGGRYEGRYDYCICNATNKGSVSFGGEATGQGAFTCGENIKASGKNAAAIGCYGGEASGVESFITGRNNKAKGLATFVSGFQNIGENDFESVVGHFAKSNKANSTWGDSGNTLFSVGNGTADNARHNAFEIRQNGDIYITSGGTDIKLQDNLGGGGGNNVIEVTQAEYDALVTAGTVDLTAIYVITDAPEIDMSNYYTSAQTNSAITAAVSGKADTSAVTESINAAVSGKMDTSAFTAYSASTDARISQDEEVTARALVEVNDALSGKQDTLSAGTNITISGNVISAEGGGKAISAGRGISITTSETTDTVSFNLPISAGTGTDSISIGGGMVFQNTSSGSRSVCMGMNSVSSGECSFACGNGAKAYAKDSVSLGDGNSATTYASFAEGCYTRAEGDCSHTSGQYTRAYNYAEFALGKYNNSVSASTTFGNSGNTLFSVGNGTANNARHNALEIRQNGDIYITLNGQDVKLQDNLGGEVSSAITSGDTNAVAGGAVYDKFDEVEQVTAAALNSLNDALGGMKFVKLTQQEYDALTVKDPMTVYFITNVV